MRICYFADGRSVHTKRWMKFFAEKGHEMHLISFAPMSAGDVEDFKQINVECHGDIGLFYLKKIWLTLQNLRRLKKILREEKIEILHCHYMTSNAWYSALSGFHPYIITIMGGGDVVGKDWKPDKNIQEKNLTPLALRKADLITSWSQLMADVARPFCRAETPIEVVHGGIHLENFFPGEKPAYLLEQWNIPRDAKVIFSPRLMRPLSNIDKIAEAFKLVSQEMPDAYLLIACPKHVVDDEYTEKIKRILTDAGLIEKTRFTVGVPHHEIADYFRLADVTVSIPDTDGTPMTVLESMACGTPAVIGDLPDYDKRYFENGETLLMIDIKNPQSIAGAVLKFLNDEKLTKKITAEARRRVVETGSYESQMLKMERLYESLVTK